MQEMEAPTGTDPEPRTACETGKLFHPEAVASELRQSMKEMEALAGAYNEP